jgi:hypothetical protein
MHKIRRLLYVMGTARLVRYPRRRSAAPQSIHRGSNIDAMPTNGIDYQGGLHAEGGEGGRLSSVVANKGIKATGRTMLEEGEKIAWLQIHRLSHIA